MTTEEMLDLAMSYLSMISNAGVGEHELRRMAKEGHTIIVNAEKEAQKKEISISPDYLEIP